MVYVEGAVTVTSTLALVTNALLMATTAVGSSHVSHAHFFTLRCVSLTGMLVSLLSLVHATMALDATTSLLLQNALVGMFASGCVGGSASVIWINWWSLVRADNVHLPSNRGMSQATAGVLGLVMLLSVVWLQLVVFPVVGSSQRKLGHYFRLYSFMTFTAAVWSVFCNVTHVPSVELTTDAFRTGRKRNHDCNADCLCSDSDLFSDATRTEGKTREETNTSVLTTGQVFNIPTTVNAIW